MTAPLPSQGNHEPKDTEVSSTFHMLLHAWDLFYKFMFIQRTKIDVVFEVDVLKIGYKRLLYPELFVNDQSKFVYRKLGLHH